MCAVYSCQTHGPKWELLDICKLVIIELFNPLLAMVQDIKSANLTLNSPGSICKEKRDYFYFFIVSLDAHYSHFQD